jgi:potassium voltage-gated channel Eag-related subfamily H protein 7
MSSSSAQIVPEAEGNPTPGDADEDLAKRQKESAQYLEKVEAMLENIRKQEQFLIMPETALMQKWDMVILSCLFFTATVTPYEVAFMDTEINGMFFVNRLVDLCFLLDMFLNFILMYHNEDGRLIRSRRLITKRYLKGWFLLDFITILPYDSAKFIFSGDISALRLVRLCRLAKLLRILRASRIFNRWETRLGLQHTTMMTFKLCFMLLASNHWLACLWGMLAYMQSASSPTWLTNWLEGQKSTTVECTTDGGDEFLPANGAYRVGCFYHLDVYVACLHWSMMTITSIGYGDIVPSNSVEYAVCVVFMLFAGVAWAHIIGEICGIAAAGDPVESEYHQVEPLTAVPTLHWTCDVMTIMP